MTNPTPRAPARRKGSLVIGFLAGFVLACLVAGVAWWELRTGMWQTRIDMSRPTVVRQIQQLQRLETVVFGLDKIVAGEKTSRYLPTFLAGDRLLLVVYGEVTAGVDLARMNAADVSVSGRAIRITLPAAEIFSTRIDNGRTRVFSRETGLLTRVDPNLESDVRREAEQQVRAAALEGGVLRIAAGNARTTMTSFVKGFGFEQVDIR